MLWVECCIDIIHEGIHIPHKSRNPLVSQFESRRSCSGVHTWGSTLVRFFWVGVLCYLLDVGLVVGKE